NHHIYLGWTAQHPRFDRDLLAASYQSYQYPYLYWPAYQLMRVGASGVVAGIVLASLQVAVAPALWLIARACMPERSWHATVMRACAVVLALLGQVSLSLLDTTAVDGLAATPLVWAVAFALVAGTPHTAVPWLTPARSIALSGLMAGVSTGFKLSNGPLALVLPLLWIMAGAGSRQRLLNVVRGGAWTIVGFVLAYGYWGWMLWQQFGNPIFPFGDGAFAPLRAALGWTP
ncbi:MAG TPA: hypothetical protein VFX31_13940, partial [Ktedonobacterales bacterium]|nr:hypothetical protein [Ktedonobacterales bacterium]